MAWHGTPIIFALAELLGYSVHRVTLHANTSKRVLLQQNAKHEDRPEEEIRYVPNFRRMRLM